MSHRMTLASTAGPTVTADELFRAAYGDGPVVVTSAPGRVNLVGEHTD